MSAGTVTVPRGLLWALVGGLAVTSLTAAFLLGRQTAAPGPAPTPPVEVSDAAPSAASAGPASATTPPAPAPPPTEVAASSASADPAPPTAGAEDGAAAARAAGAYLSQMDAAVAQGQTGMSPDAMAQAILQDAMAGRTDGFDRLLALNQAVLDQVRAIRPPASCGDCATHHRRTRDLLQRSIALLSTLRDATAQGDLRALAGAQDRAVALETEARALEALEARIVAEHGG